MAIDVIGRKLISGLKKYRYSILILFVGFVLMAIPTNAHLSKEESSVKNNEIAEICLEQRLSEALSQMCGAGKVEVVLTKAEGEEVIYQTNQDTSNNDASNQMKSNTVTITDSDRNQSGLVRQINPERYRGAIILCQGADDPTVCLAIVDAVSKATGLGTNRISVLKLK